MINREDIQLICDDIVREFAPLQVILFGSYAYGAPTEDSDVDLLVVMEIPESETRHVKLSRFVQRIPRRFSYGFACSIAGRDRLSHVAYNDWFLREVTEKGEVLYESSNFFAKSLKREELPYESVNAGMDTKD